MKKLIAAAIIVLVGVASAAPASAEPRGERGWQSQRQRGRSRHWRGRRQYWNPHQGWYYDPLGGFLGGLFGGFIGSQMNRGDDEDRDRK